MIRLSDEALAELMRHTPGPWRIDHANLGGFVIEGSDRAVLCQRADWPLRMVESIINGKLIAAAPSLLSEVVEARAIVKELVEALEKANKLIVALMPGVRHIALQDYAALNETPLAIKAALSRARKVSDDKD